MGKRGHHKLLGVFKLVTNRSKQHPAQTQRRLLLDLNQNKLGGTTTSR